jgi:D-glycero-D-manno-heptose 1,7-bisphosphate phosphatase
MPVNKAIFLDRDGVINQERGEYTYKREDFVFCEGLFAALQKLAAAGFKLVVITNQSGIDKGVYTHSDVEKLHEFMIGELKKHGIDILEVYYSPHHPEVTKSISRKPDSVMVEKAMARFNIDPRLSFFIGDRDRDVEAAQKCGLRPIKINSNESLLPALSKIL